MEHTPDQLNMDGRIIRDMSEGILTVGMDGRILSVNGIAEKILGKRRGDLIGNLFTDCFVEHVEDDAFNRTILTRSADISPQRKTSCRITAERRRSFSTP